MNCNRNVLRVLTIGFMGSMFAHVVMAQSPDTPMARMRPIGAPSAVDQFLRQPTLRETAYQSSANSSAANDTYVRQAQFEVPPLPGNANGTPPNVSNPLPNASLPSPNLPPVGVVPNSRQLGAGVPLSPTFPRNGIPSNHIPTTRFPTSSSDLTPVPAPQLHDQFANIGNCCCISAASEYSAASGFGPGGCCAPVNYQAPIYGPSAIGAAPYAAPPAQIAAPAILPGDFTAPARSGAPAGALVTFGQEQNLVQVGQGLFGQPKAYVPGQSVRNWLRYFTP